MPRMRIGVGCAAFVLVAAVAAAQPAQTPSPPDDPAAQPGSGAPSSPLAIHVGDADLLFGGFIDATAIRRTTNTGSGLGTAFGTIPFANTVQGHMNDTQFSSQNSRLTLQATSKAGTADLKGVLEMDFLGNAPNGLTVTANSNTLRMRVFWGQYRQGAFDFLAGQAWSLMTPNRNGLSPETADIFFTQTLDPNSQAGLTWGRPMQFRLTTHPNDNVTAAVSIENPDQYVGSGVKLPAGFPSGQVDTGAAVNDVPNAFPDIIGKIAFDPKGGGTHQHFDAAMLVRRFKTYSLDTDTTFGKTAVGGALTAAVEPVSSVRLVGTGFYSSGGGRYIGYYESAGLDRQPRRQHDAGDHLVGSDRHRDSGRQQDEPLRLLQRGGRESAPSPPMSTAARSDLVCRARRRRTNASPKRRQASSTPSFETRRSAASSSWGSTHICGARLSPCPPARRPTRRST